MQKAFLACWNLGLVVDAGFMSTDQVLCQCISTSSSGYEAYRLCVCARVYESTFSSRLIDSVCVHACTSQPSLQGL